jgi:hypothetical protein
MRAPLVMRVVARPVSRLTTVMPVLSFYKEAIFPKLLELHQIKHPKTASSG